MPLSARLTASSLLVRLPFVIGLLCLAATVAFGQDVVGKKRKKIKIRWSKFETEHYLIRHEKAVPRRTAKRIGQELEDILTQYRRIFRAAPEKKFKVKFMDSQNTYEQEGGDPSHPGFYNGGSKYLVIKQMPFARLIPIVYHEAFHQYLHFYIGDGVSIPTWFNEGMAMYYEGMQRERSQNKSRTPKLDPTSIDFRKIRMVKDAIFTRTSISFKKLVDASYKEFHDKEFEDLSYTQSFSIVYFLMKTTKGKVPLRYATALRESKSVEAADEKIFGKKRKRLKKVAKAWKRYVAKHDIPEA